MPFKSKKQIAKWGELVKEGKISKDKFDESLAATKNPEALPDRLKNQTIGQKIKSLAKVKKV